MKSTQRTPSDPLFTVREIHRAPLIAHGDPGTERNTYGFEGGVTVKLDGVFHLFTTEMSGTPIWTKTRLAHWSSADGLAWARVSTVMESSGNFDGSDTHACLWSPMPTFDPELDRWVLTYVCYRSKPNTEEAWYRNYDGRIAIAVSRTPGSAGIGGPYDETGFIMEPGHDSAPWEGLMGVDSFFPYRVGAEWLAWYGSSPEVNGLAAAPSLSGPWRRIITDGPVSRHTENPVVTLLPDGRFVAFFDGCGHHQKMGYMVSHDGLSWSEPILLDLDSHPDRWWALSRTPVGLTELDDGAFALYFTAYNRNFYDIPGIWSATSDSVFDGYFAGVGRLVLDLVRNP